MTVFFIWIMWKCKLSICSFGCFCNFSLFSLLSLFGHTCFMFCLCSGSRYIFLLQILNASATAMAIFVKIHFLKINLFLLGIQLNGYARKQCYGGRNASIQNKAPNEITMQRIINEVQRLYNKVGRWFRFVAVDVCWFRCVGFVISLGVFQQNKLLNDAILTFACQIAIRQ